ncbi:FCD domain-containing protein [Rhizobium bangladeshense]|uniref:FCD domain-containing protein n=1 Tax=Rhizobium bangladeshense TaxID=1138189 RepID=A0ABS7LNU4_9HYPH|nr:GntR family transcriptional regulator [Rhizobium bangladeshense]MBY3592388.1 FCD domain-containing protein [Rhizobium bangladeshense]
MKRPVSSKIKEVLEPDIGRPPPATVAEAVYRKLRSDIVWGALPPGSRLRSDHLRVTYGVGVSPLREALSRLAAERFVTSIGQRGFRVAPIDEATVRDVTETRIIIEREALRYSILSGELKWETSVVGAFHALSRCPLPSAAGEGAETWAGYHRAFHMQLLAGSRSAWQQDIASQLFDQSERFRVLLLQRPVGLGAARDIATEHKEIVDAVLARDVDGAISALERHYWSTAQHVISVLRYQNEEEDDRQRSA